MCSATPGDYRQGVTRLWYAVVAALTACALVGQAVLTVERDGSLVNVLS